MRDPIINYLVDQLKTDDKSREQKRADYEFGKNLRRSGESLNTLQQVSPNKYIDTRPSLNLANQISTDKAKRFVASGMNPAHIVIIRHGATEQTDKTNDQSAPIDGPLDDKGKEEAIKLANKLNAEKLDGLVLSPMQRTQETGSIISQKTGVPVLTTLQGLMPWNRGQFTGHTKQDQKIRDFFAEHHPDEKVVPDGETFNEFKNRLLNTVKNIQNNYRGKRVGLVMHSSGNKTISAWEKKGMPENNDIDIKEFLKEGMKPGEFREIRKEPVIREF